MQEKQPKSLRFKVCVRVTLIALLVGVSYAFDEKSLGFFAVLVPLMLVSHWHMIKRSLKDPGSLF